MKFNFIKFLILFGLMLVLTACPYKSKVPIGLPEEKIDKNLLGEWISAADLEYDNPTYYIIKKFSKVKYSMTEMSYSSYDSTYTDTKYFIHSTTIGNRTFLNIQEQGGGDYHLHYISMDDDEFELFEVSENVDEQFSTSSELKSFVEKNMEYSFFYTKGEARYIKKEK